MGVYRLLSYCLDRRQQCVEYVDLVEEAASKDGIEILVDYYSFQQFLVKKYWDALSAVTNNPYLRLLGGEYRSLDEYMTKLIKDLQSLDIHFVMFIDGAKGSSKIGTEQKMNTWKFRHMKDLEKMQDLISVLNRYKRIEDLSSESNIRPVLLEVQIMETLKECKCEVVQCPSGEADFVIARNLQSRPKAFAILSNDSDFCVFSCCKFIPNELFDLQNDLQLGGTEFLPAKPIRLMVGMIRSTKVTSLLELHDHTELIELSIICGNDFTTSHVKHLKSKVGLHRQSITEAAAWVREYRRVENHPDIRREMDRSKAFASSVQRSRQFYNIDLPEDGSASNSFLSLLINENTVKGNFPPTIMGMHHNFYWYRMLLEDCGSGQPSVEGALSDLRTFIYRMVLNHNDDKVVEYGRAPYDKFTSTVVYAAQPARFLDMNNIQPNKIFANLKTFHRVMTHYEPGFPIEWYKRYGWNTGYICYMLRYFIVLNTGYNLHITPGEFIPLAAMVFCRVDEKWYQSLCILPTLRCITVGNWFQDIVRHTYLFLAKLLFLSHEFSQPKVLFSGAVWSAFYMVINHEGQLRGPRGLPNQSIQRIKKDMMYILNEKRHMLKYVAEGYYDIEPMLDQMKGRGRMR
ncbi:hypothetical protein LSH36_110g03068 [Paralvinella palmiformis]|uniref:Asteroid domain-containing protein n=1 Tax=Paralvinella palmiformis TaxID=53620 RepID=A0AAD9JZT7_9ANNE|nr:hypothetical protein LSH36_110g03068 [Paralvinella palmiformis]